MKLLALVRGQRLAWQHTKGALKPRIKTRWPSWKLQRLRMLMSATVRDLTLRRLMPRIATRLPCRTDTPIPAERHCSVYLPCHVPRQPHVGVRDSARKMHCFVFIQVSFDIK